MHTHIYKVKERRNKITITIIKEFLEKKLKNLDLA
jgi:hypothetical protein